MTTCSITTSDGDFYDLSPLTLANDNYKVTVKDGVARLFTINVCTPLVQAQGTYWSQPMCVDVELFKSRCCLTFYIM